MFRTKTVKSYPKKMKHLRTSLSKIVYKLIEKDADVTGEYSYQFSKDADETMEAVWT